MKSETTEKSQNSRKKKTKVIILGEKKESQNQIRDLNHNFMKKIKSGSNLKKI